MKWQVLSSPEDHIASIMVKVPLRYHSWISDMFSEGATPYSGIVISKSGGYLDGSNIEKNCYSLGGFKFLYRSYLEKDDIEDGSGNLANLKRLIEIVASNYVTDIIGESYYRVVLEKCWAVCQREGDYGTIHTHTAPGYVGNARYSGMLYLSSPAGISPETFPNGCLHIITGAEVVYFPPVPGSVVLWPAGLMHGIHPFRGPGDRLGIAFDVIVEEKGIQNV